MSPKNINHTRSLYIDLELTCWQGPPPNGMNNEIIQLGLCEVDMVKLEITRSQRFYIRPKAAWEISPYCTKLTGITQDQITKLGRPFNEVLSTITNQWGPKSKMTYAWGNDFEDIQKTCHAMFIANPWSQIFDLGLTFRSSFLMRRAVNLEAALGFLDLEFEGKAHDALVDAKNTAALHIEMIKRLRQTLPVASAA